MQYKMTAEQYQPYGVAVFADMAAVEAELDNQNVTDPDARQAYIDALEEIDDSLERVVFDNGGGVTLQLRGWAHHYDDARWAAQDVAAWIKSHDTSDWEGHEPEALVCDPTYDEIRNGGYRVWTVGDDPIDEGWANADDFFAALARLTK